MPYTVRCLSALSELNNESLGPCKNEKSVVLSGSPALRLAEELTHKLRILDRISRECHFTEAFYTDRCKTDGLGPITVFPPGCSIYPRGRARCAGYQSGSEGKRLTWRTPFRGSAIHGATVSFQRR